MCGIFGQYHRLGPIVDYAPLCLATNTLAHRGPDDGTWWADGPFFLGHRRLSIIDLSQGAQPMVTPDGRYVIAFNGEIYNFLELRQELKRQGCLFKTNSDTEVILQGYLAWGVDLPSKLIGMFAFAIVDRQEEALFLARDRFGEKPLFIHETPQSITFASELSALLTQKSIEREMDMVALGEFLCLNYIPGERTLVKGIKKLGAGTWFLYTKTGKKEGSYWSISTLPKNGTNQNLNEVIESLCHRIDGAVNIALRSDVPVTLFLSGGIDSSIIAESAVRQGKLKHAYCLDVYEEGFSEWENAKYVADKLNIELRRVNLSVDHLEDFFKIVEHADDPLADSSAVALWRLSREVSQDYKVIISGDGADELFGGYLTYKATFWHHLITSNIPFNVRRFFAYLSQRIPVSNKKVSNSYKLARFLRAADLSPAEAHFTWNGSWLPRDAAQLLSSPEASLDANKVLLRLIERHSLVSTPSLSQLQQVDLTDYLVNDILVKVDRMTMAHGLEARAPYLIPSVVDLALSLPEAYKLTYFGKPKRILRELAVQLYGPKIAYAKKQGFSIPVHRWLRGSARHWVEELLSESKLNALGVVDTKAVLAAKNAHLKGFKQLGFELWGMMVLVAWYDARIQGKIKREVTTNSLRRVLA